MSPFPRPDYRVLTRYHFDRTPVDLDLSDNTNQWGAHPGAVHQLSVAAGDGLAKYPELYADDLRAAVSERLGVDPDCVTTGCGSDDVLDSIYRAVGGSSNDFVAAATPTFSMALPLATMNGMQSRAVPWASALERPEALLEGGPALVYVCRPNNPTGHVAPTAWVEALIAAAGNDGPLILVDEAYIDFGGDSFVGLAVSEPRLIVTRTLSKAFGLAGLRVGYAVASPQTALEVEKSRGPYKVGRAAAEAAAAALRDHEGWIPTTVSECTGNRDRLQAALIDRGIEVEPSAASFVLFKAPSGSAAEDAAALRLAGVAVRPFPGCWKDGTDALRVTLAPWPAVERFLGALDRTSGRAGDQ